MSRVGKKPIAIPPGVTVTVHPDRIDFEGQKGKLTTPLRPGITAAVEGDSLVISRSDDTKAGRANHGLGRALAHNAVVGVSEGYAKQLEIVGVGYRAKVDKGRLEISLGYSRPVVYPIPEGIEITAEKPTLLSVRGIDRQKVGQVADDIKSLRIPDPYKQKGVRYVGERLIKKERKAGVAGA
ncbi:MAG TPA: 50S ribosomal protein L6 [Candidatus Aminicenantes bacterium]|nr:50S ribosomal protein L6 [Candidatus Aminicenantes bacterium]HDT12926.1 50S ribosomal protein L6 [Candidatus Aminicenantes bacterium]